MEVSLQAGRVVGEHWRLRSRLGVEGTSRFWEAEELHTGGRVVMELSSVDLADPAVKSRFCRETHVLTAFRSSHVVRTMHRGSVGDDLAFAVTEMLHGEDLSRLLARESALELAHVAQILDESCRGISRLDAVRIPHRVLEPKHVFLVADRANARVVKLLNVGLGRGNNARDSDSVLPYVSPERDARAPQVWAIGVIAYRMLVGSLPFVTNDQKTRDVDWRTRFARLREERIDLPLELDDWFQTAMHPDPSQRFATVEQAGLAFGHIASTYASGKAARLRRQMERTSQKPPPLPSKSAKTPANVAPVGGVDLLDVELVDLLDVELGEVLAREPSGPRDREPVTIFDAAAPDPRDPGAPAIREPAPGAEPARTARSRKRAEVAEFASVAAAASEDTAFAEWNPPVATVRGIESDSAEVTPSERTPIVESAVESQDSAAARPADAAEVERGQAAVPDQRRATLGEPSVGHERSMNADQDANAMTAQRTTVVSRLHASARRRKRVAASERVASFARERDTTERLTRASSVGVDRAVASNAGSAAERRSSVAGASFAAEHSPRPTPDRDHLAIVIPDRPTGGEYRPEYDATWDQLPRASLARHRYSPAVRAERAAGVASDHTSLARVHLGRSDASAMERTNALRAERDRWRISAVLAVLLGLIAGFALRSVVSNQHRTVFRAVVDRTAADDGISAHSIRELAPPPTAAEHQTSATTMNGPASPPAHASQPLSHARSTASKRAASELAGPRAVDGSSTELATTLPAARQARELGHASSSRVVAAQPTEAPGDELLDPAQPQRVATYSSLRPTGVPAESSGTPRPRDARSAPLPANPRDPDTTPVQVYRGF